jgi:ATP-dependent protease ClpP protease subunit
MYWGKQKRTNNDESDEEDSQGAVITKKNHIYFYGDTTEKSMMEISMAIDAFNQDTKPYREIILHIQSWGGYVHCALGTAGVIMDSEIPVTCIVEGMAASAATIIAVAGKKRKIRSTGFMLVHEVRTVLGGKKSVIDDDYKNLQMLEDKIIEFFVERTKMPRSKFTKMLRRELCYSPEECLKLSMIHEIIGKNKKRKRGT